MSKWPRGRYTKGVLALLFACATSTGIPVDSDVGGDSGPGDSGLPADTAETGGEDTGDREKPECGELPADDAGYAALFDPAVLHTLSLTLSAAEVAELAGDPTGWAEASASLDGVEFTSIGVKWRGDSSQMRWDGKPSWVLGLRQQYACDTLAGLDRLGLDAMGDDDVQARVVLESQILSSLGRVAPHAVFATVTVNDEPFGLHALVEEVDDNFITHRYGVGGAALWAAANGTDFTNAGVEAWGAGSAGADPAVLDAVAAVVSGSDATFYAELGAVLDSADLTGHWAALAAVGDMGAWPFETDDVDLVLPVGGALQFIADRPSSGWNPAFDWTHVDTALGVRCVYDDPCSAAMSVALGQAATALAAVDTPSMLDMAFTLTAPAVADDPRRALKVSAVESARAQLRLTVAEWPAQVAP